MCPLKFWYLALTSPEQNSHNYSACMYVHVESHVDVHVHVNYTHNYTHVYTCTYHNICIPMYVTYHTLPNLHSVYYVYMYMYVHILHVCTGNAYFETL